MAERTQSSEVRVIREPVPLLDPDKRLMVLWSAKAGCTFATKWFLFQIGNLEAGLDESEGWIHNYRARKFRPSQGYVDSLERARAQPDLNVVQFIRSPLSRIISAYLAYAHVCATEAVTSAHKPTLEGLSKVLGRSIVHHQTFSFREFLTYVEGEPPETIDMHMLSQSHNFRWTGSNGIEFVPIENYESFLSPLEERLGLEHTDPARLIRSPHHTQGRRIVSTGVADLWFGNTVNAPLPTYESFLDSDTALRILKIYKRDLEAFKEFYSSDLKLLNLVARNG